MTDLQRLISRLGPLRFLLSDGVWIPVLFGPLLVFPRSLSFIPPTLTSVVFLAAAAPLILRKRTGSPLGFLIAVMFFTGLLSLSISSEPSQGTEKFSLLALGLVTLLAFAGRKGEDFGRFVRGWTAACILGISALGLVGPLFLATSRPLTLLGFSPWDHKLWEIAEDIHPNTLAGLLSIALLLTLGMLLEAVFEGRRRRAILLGTGLSLQLILTGFTHSRGGWFGFLSAASVMVFILAGKRSLVYLGSIWAIGLGVFGYYFDLYSVRTELGTRPELWDRSLHALSILPITGTGAGSFETVVPMLFPLYSFSPDGCPPHAHNLFLQIGLDLGFPGLAATTALFVLAAVAGLLAFRSAGRSRRSPLQAILAGYLASLAAILIHGLIDVPLWLNKPHALMFFVAGMILAMASFISPEYPARVPSGSGIFLTLAYWLGLSLTAISIAGSHPLPALIVATLGGGLTGAWIARRSR